MNNTINYSDRQAGQKQAGFALSLGKPTSNLAVAIALLSGCLSVATTAEAAFNIPTATVDKITGLFTPVPSPLCIAGSCRPNLPPNC